MSPSGAAGASQSGARARGAEAGPEPEERRREEQRGGAALRAWRSAPRSPARAASRVKVTKAIAGRFEESRIANWIVSSRPALPVHSFRMRSSSTSVTSLVSTTL